VCCYVLYVCVRGRGVQAKQTQDLNKKELPTKDRKIARPPTQHRLCRCCVLLYVYVREGGVQAKQTQGLNRKELPAKDKKDS
jgi:hypothetical protein